MKILILAEGRTGGTTLMEYLSNELSGHTSITEPYTNQTTGWLKQEEWLNEYENFIVKEIYGGDNYDLPKLVEKCDKVFCVYRKNWYEQIRSTLYAEKVGFIHDYNITDVNKLVTDEMIIYKSKGFIKVKERFQDFIRYNNYLSVSYEDLYYGNGIDKIKNYLGIQTQNIFPPVQRYLKDSEGNPYKPQNNNLELIDENSINK